VTAAWVLLATVTVVVCVQLVLAALVAAGRDGGPLMAVWVGFSPLLLQSGWVALAGALAAGVLSGQWLVAAPVAMTSAITGVIGVRTWWMASAPAETRPDEFDGRPGAGLRVITANVFYRNANAASAWDVLAAATPDVVVLQEISATSGSWLPPAGWHCVSVVREDAFGSAILSRTPFIASSTFELVGLPQIRAVIRHEGREVVVYCVHPAAPAGRGADVRWRRQFAELTQRLTREPPGPVVVGGDFNATPLHRPFRDLLTESGFRDARPRRRSLFATWPSGGAGSPLGVPRVMSLDHVLVRGAGVRSADLLPPTSGDHLPVAVDIALD